MQKTLDATGMTALHWACTEANAIPVVPRFVAAVEIRQKQMGNVSGNNNNNNIHNILVDCRDGSLHVTLIAAQYGHVELAAYLLQKGACQFDGCGRYGPAHWAAYKGSTTVLGLLSYHEQNNNNNNGAATTTKNCC
jgi:ankyrin repeat protein